MRVDLKKLQAMPLKDARRTLDDFERQGKSDVAGAPNAAARHRAEKLLNRVEICRRWLGISNQIQGMKRN
jgi:hypothetical protein